MLYRRHLPDAIRLAYLMTGDRMLAEDLSQEAFIRLTGRFEHIRNRDAFPAYLRRTVVHLALNQFRRRRTERDHLEEAAKLAGDRTPLDHADTAAVRSALLSLPYRQRAAIVLRYYEDLSERQTADLLNCRPGTVKSLLSRGIESLRRGISMESEDR
jgi:RNA polymerase sigma-70 factor (sigma-E family)